MTSIDRKIDEFHAAITVFNVSLKALQEQGLTVLARAEAVLAQMEREAPEQAEAIRPKVARLRLDVRYLQTAGGIAGA